MKRCAPSVICLSILAACAPTAFLRSDPPLLAARQPLSAPTLTTQQSASPAGGGAASGQDVLDLGGAYRAEPDPRGRLELSGNDQPPEPPLLGWNGDVVEASPPGNSVEENAASRALDPEPGGRTYIIELYQQALDERDALAQKVDELTRSLALAQSTLAGSADNLRGLEERLGGFETENQRLQRENEELSARLATAQIRRLEAEKLLLEAQIRWHREQPEAEDIGARQGG